MYTVYKTVNLINGKHYIGVHKTDDPNDDYFGSGIAIVKAIKKYGKNSFKKEILLVSDSKTEAFLLEKELTKDYVENTNYNMRLGGTGGFTPEKAKLGYENSFGSFSKEQRRAHGLKGYLASILVTSPAESGRLGGKANKGKPKSEEHKQKIRDAWVLKKLKADGAIG